MSAPSPSILSNSTVYYWKGRRRIPWETTLQPSTVSSSRPSQSLIYSFVITRKGETLWPTWQTLIPKAPFDSYPMPSIHKLSKCFEGFTCCTALDLNMGFWTIPLDIPSQHLIILPWGKYCYLCLPMGLACSLDIYQEKMSELFINMISIIAWYHENLLHPGANRMFQTISQHFTWPSLRTQVENFVKHCNTCQHYKAQRKEVWTQT
jgi:hypothetical protein